jgi:hypothetical protein
VSALGIAIHYDRVRSIYRTHHAAATCGKSTPEACSLAHISFFFPKSEKGNALALNAGLGNLGVSVVQFVIPLAITAGVFGWFGGDPQIAVEGGKTSRRRTNRCPLVPQSR